MLIKTNVRGEFYLENNRYFEVLNDIKNTLLITRNKIIENVNKDLILMYYNI